jgi:hypothetical protein
MQALGVVWAETAADLFKQRAIVSALAEPIHFGSRLLFDFWEDRAAHGGLTMGRDVPSRELRSVLRNLGVYEPVNNGADFRFRLAGAGFLRRYGKDITGSLLSQHYRGAEFDRRHENLLGVIQTGRPSLHEVRVPQDTRPALRMESIELPMFAPDRQFTWVLGGLFYYDWTG